MGVSENGEGFWGNLSSDKLVTDLDGFSGVYATRIVVVCCQTNLKNMFVCKFGSAHGMICQVTNSCF